MSKFVITILLFFTSCIIILSSAVQNPTVVSPGVFYEEESGQILYEATAPIIYQFQVPKWNNFLGLEIQNCQTTPGLTDYCQIFDIFESISNDIQSVTTPASLSSFPEQTSQSTWGLKCHYLSQHFSSIRVDSAVVQKYLGFLRSCSKGTILEEELNTEYSSKPIVQRFEDIKGRFESDFIDQFDPNGDSVSHSAIGLNHYETLLSTGFTSFIAETIRWNSAISTCKSGLIPDSLLTPTMFLDSLKKLNKTAETNGLTFVVQPIAEFLPLYFKAPLADCTFSGDTFIVRILIPVKKAKRQWIHISAQTIPFYQKTSNASELLYSTKEQFDGKEPFFYEKVSKRLFQAKDCDISRPAFCRLPEFWDRSLVTSGSCVWAILQGNSTEVPKEYCTGVGIQDIRNIMVIPVLVKKGTDTFFVTGLPDGILRIECSEFDGSVTTHEFSFPQKQGTLEVRLPCFCKIISDGVEYEAEAPCQVLSDMLSVTETWHQDFQA